MLRTPVPMRPIAVAAVLGAGMLFSGATPPPCREQAPPTDLCEQIGCVGGDLECFDGIAYVTVWCHTKIPVHIVCREPNPLK